MIIELSQIYRAYMRGTKLKQNPLRCTLAACKTIDLSIVSVKSPQRGLRGSTSKRALSSPKAHSKANENRPGFNLGLKSFKELNELIDYIPASPIKAHVRRLNSSRRVMYSSPIRRVTTNSPFSYRLNRPTTKQLSNSPQIHLSKKKPDLERVSASQFCHRLSVDLLNKQHVL